MVLRPASNSLNVTVINADPGSQQGEKKEEGGSRYLIFKQCLLSDVQPSLGTLKLQGKA